MILASCNKVTNGRLQWQSWNWFNPKKDFEARTYVHPRAFSNQWPGDDCRFYEAGIAFDGLEREVAMVVRNSERSVLNLARNKCEAPFFVNMESFFEFSFWISEELLDLEARYKPRHGVRLQQVSGNSRLDWKRLSQGAVCGFVSCPYKIPWMQIKNLLPRRAAGLVFSNNCSDKWIKRILFPAEFNPSSTELLL